MSLCESDLLNINVMYLFFCIFVLSMYFYWKFCFHDTSASCLLLSFRASAGKPTVAGDDDEDIQLPPPDAQFKSKKKKEKRHKKKPYPTKRPSKIKHLDPLFIGESWELRKNVVIIVYFGLTCGKGIQWSNIEKRKLLVIGKYS